MPTKPAKPCRYPGCPALTSDKSGYCQAHAKQVARQYDRERGSSTQRGYDRRWAEYSRHYLMEHPLCVKCQQEGRVVASEVTDHIIPVSGPADPLFWDPADHQPLCSSCHSTKTATEDGAFGNTATKQAKSRGRGYKSL